MIENWAGSTIKKELKVKSYASENVSQFSWWNTKHKSSQKCLYNVGQVTVLQSLTKLLI